MHPAPPFSSQNIQLENTCWTKTAMAQATVWRIKNGALLAMQTQRLRTVSKWTPRKIGGTIMKVLHAGIIMASRIIPSLTLPVLLRINRRWWKTLDSLTLHDPKGSRCTVPMFSSQTYWIGTLPALIGRLRVFIGHLSSGINSTRWILWIRRVKRMAIPPLNRYWT